MLQRAMTFTDEDTKERYSVRDNAVANNEQLFRMRCAVPESLSQAARVQLCCWRITNIASLSLAVPCISRNGVSAMLFFGLSSFLLLSIGISQSRSPRHENADRAECAGRK